MLVLIHPDLSQPFVVDVDALETGVRAVLSQHSGPDKKLNISLSNWDWRSGGNGEAAVRGLDQSQEPYCLDPWNINLHGLSRKHCQEEVPCPPDTILPSSQVVATLRWEV